MEKLRGPLEDQLSSALQAAVDQVDDGYDGESVEQVSDELLATTKSGLHKDIAAGFEPHQEQGGSVAVTIVDDST